MKTNKDCALSALMSAAMALPIVSISVQAEELIPPVLPVGAAMGIRHLTYREAHDRMKVNESVVWLKSPIGENWEVSASGSIDIVSGASPIIVSNQSGRPMQILTGASITDRRIARDASVKRRWHDLTLGFSYASSTEEDYNSHASGVSLDIDFNQRNTTLTLSQGISNDRVRSVTNTSLNERRDQREFLVGITQLIDRYSLLQSNLSRTHDRGFLNDPYRLTASFFNTPPRLLLSADLRPDSRERWAWLNRYKRNLSTQQAVVTAEYRYNRDDW
ncbi:MAG: DUF3570 domain-containing protein, partial [Betaproteobacteria bacterium]|nr:DUF3570 domain-containing protein [Betaproteobacteria bacterium]